MMQDRARLTNCSQFHIACSNTHGGNLSLRNSEGRFPVMSPCRMKDTLHAGDMPGEAFWAAGYL